VKKPEGSYLEIRVGAFVLFGIALLAYMAVQFGDLTNAARKYYTITVEFPNAAGLLKDSDVLLGGAKVGRVAKAPEITLTPQVLDRGPAVRVELALFEGARVPQQSRFLVGSAGLLGDRFVEVLPDPNYDAQQFVEPGAVVAGSREFGLEDLAVEGGALVDDLRKAVADINSAVLKLDNDLFSKTTIENLAVALKNLRVTAESFARTSEKIENASAKLEGIMDAADTAMDKGAAAMETTQKAAEDLRAAIADTRELIAKTSALMEAGLSGGGVMSTLLNDRETAENLKALISNLRLHGVLFYKDRSSEPAETPRRRSPRSPGPGHPGR
jgi:phospholipid/cholesterol/gamma-HCH transport system substrate-binding protein